MIPPDFSFSSRYSFSRSSRILRTEKVKLPSPTRCHSLRISGAPATMQATAGVIATTTAATTCSTFMLPFKDMSPSTKELMKLVLEEKIAHGGHPVLRWMMDNIFIRTDPAGNIKADKEKSTEKIDGAIATIMGLDRAIRCGNDTGASVYDSRGLLFI